MRSIAHWVKLFINLTKANSRLLDLHMAAWTGLRDEDEENFISSPGPVATEQHQG